MKKVLNFICVITFLIYSSVGFAENLSNFYHGYQHKKIGDNLNVFPPTDITLINASCCVVNVSVANLNFYILPQSYEHLYNDTGRFFPLIILRDPNYNLFFNATVCPVAIVTIFGGPGYYNVIVDSDLCY